MKFNSHKRKKSNSTSVCHEKSIEKSTPIKLGNVTKFQEIVL